MASHSFLRTTSQRRPLINSSYLAEECVADPFPRSLYANEYQPVPGLTAKGWQVITVEYTNSTDLRFKLAGVDTVISTISGTPQLTLIDCCAAARVRRFVPSEFGGPPALRPQDDPLDGQRRAAIIRLSQRESSGMRFCVFTCGIFYERFQPGGMAASQLGVNSSIGQEGDYLMNYRRRAAQLPYNTSNGHSASVSMIGARDLAQAVVGALDLSSWPREYRVRGERMSVRDLVAVAEQVQGKSLYTTISAHN